MHIFTSNIIMHTYIYTYTHRDEPKIGRKRVKMDYISVEDVSRTDTLRLAEKTRLSFTRRRGFCHAPTGKRIFHCRLCRYLHVLAPSEPYPIVSNISKHASITPRNVQVSVFFRHYSLLPVAARTDCLPAWYIHHSDFRLACSRFYDHLSSSRKTLVHP